ncbi:MAG TPA: hypothetical protein EYP25_04125 [Anaerolineae bacterium]|nr:hypothetical protein [Caldilineae bacterium]HID33750.1 hypothetical protein [Anaerolineae bacterium]
MHLEDQFEEWQRNSLLHMKTADDWKPVWLGLGLLAFVLGLAFLKRVIEQQEAAKINAFPHPAP